MIRIVHNKLLGGWFIVRGPHQTPLGGRFDTKAAAEAHLKRKEVGRTMTDATTRGWRNWHAAPAPKPRNGLADKLNGFFK